MESGWNPWFKDPEVNRGVGTSLQRSRFRGRRTKGEIRGDNDGRALGEEAGAFGCRDPVVTVFSDPRDPCRRVPKING
ncbi:hypothetical protein NDU88_011254 [Pleurodeles waltl]|uniref:Uncharacterized protein n=1 Tax=Pleurodeles waltl TaxID=8319 RepID=A0AAV7QZV7_PLEWA|nr:hypothetical protein NDU88_011254 [Pleurodeles waltl]